MSSTWDMSLKKLGDQMDEFQLSQEANLQHEQDRLRGFEESMRGLLKLVETADAQGLVALPRLLQTVVSHQTTGIIILGQDGKILLFNSVANRIFAQTLAESTIDGLQRCCQFFHEDTFTPFDTSKLPWVVSLKGETVAPLKLFVKRRDFSEGMWISAACTALQDTSTGGGVTGVVVLVIDLTEHVKINNQLQGLCKQLENQISNIESGKEEIKTLTDILGRERREPRSAAATLSPLHPPPVSPPPAQAAVKTALVVDDIPVNQKLLIMQLKKIGFQVESVFSGTDALAKIKTNDYSLIFMDCDMPVMNGYEATMLIRQEEIKSGRHIPIVAMTSYDRSGDRERCLSVGMDEYLTKGATPDQLANVVQWCLERSSGPREVPVVEVEEKEPELLLDITRLIKEFGEYEAEEILRLFLMSATTLTSCLQFALDDTDVDSVKHFAYALKGPCSSVGLRQLALIALDISNCAEAGHWTDAMSSYRELRKLYELVKTQVEDASNKYRWSLH